ncbi:MAG: UbiD family decarboxylase [Chloroflexi bacterium]|nr:UbiD family decarboxylase [Chloroflexota bacterium]
MAYDDVREYMDALEKWGELVRIEAEVDWNLEIGAVMRHSCEIGTPAAHFKKIRGYGPEYSVFGPPVARGSIATWSKVAIAMELDPEIPYHALQREYMRRISNPIKPYQVSTGPCKENIHVGKDVNLFKFPVPYIHEGDGGRYIATWAFTITKDPDSDWTNWGVYRQMIHTRNRTGGLIWPQQHNGMMYYRKYEARNKPMPFATVIGCDPICTIVGTIAFPAGVNEADMAGGIRQEPVQLVKCETNDLLVPATAEIVIEGVVMPRERWDEGPFGEYTGYRASPRMPRPVYRVECVTHRNNPVFTANCEGIPITESHLACQSLGSCAQALLSFRDAGIPVRDAYVPPHSAGNGIVVAVKKDYAGIAHHIVGASVAHKEGFRYLHTVICDDDVDVHDLNQVMHAFATKCNPRRGVQQKDYSVGWGLVPFLDLHERQFAKGYTAAFDCTWPVEWDRFSEVPPKASFSQAYPEELQNAVIDNWTTKYGMPASGK